MVRYDATTTIIFDTPPYLFFAIIGIVFATSFFIILLLKYNYSIPRYTKIFLLSSIGLLLGSLLFGCLSSLYSTLANSEKISIHTFTSGGIVFYGGMIGFLSAFLLICKIWNKKIENGVLDLVVVCIPLFHFFGRLGCYYAGCCFGIENYSILSIIYTTNIDHEIITLSRFPVQLLEAFFNLCLFVFLLILLSKKRFKEHLTILYLIIYAVMRIFVEMLRGDEVRGVWNGVSFSQVVSVAILLFCVLYVYRKQREKKHEEIELIKVGVNHESY